MQLPGDGSRVSTQPEYAELNNDEHENMGADHDKVAQDVGFYKMSNACGRLVGVMSGGALSSFYSVDSGGDTHANSLSFTACLWDGGVLF